MSADVQRLYNGDVNGLGYVMNTSRLWAHDPTALDCLSMAEWMDARGFTSPRLRWFVEYATRDDYGTLLEFREFLDDAHRRGLRVITELVCNHTSDQHAWFQQALAAAEQAIAQQIHTWRQLAQDRLAEIKDLPPEPPQRLKDDE